jgi:AraC-like DNA-binding protein
VERDGSCDFIHYPVNDRMKILEIVEKKAIPWVEAGGLQRFVIGGTTPEQYPLPQGMQSTQVKMKGRRVAVHGAGPQSHRSNYLAYWPEAGLVEMRLPFVGCIVSGRVDYQIGNRIYHCSEGDFFLVPPKVPYPDRMQTDEGVIEIPDVLAFNAWDNHRQCCVCHGDGGNYLFPEHGTVQLLDLFIDELLARRPGFERVGANAFLTFLYLLTRELREHHYFHSGMAILNVQTDEPKLDPIQRVQQYIQSHLNEALSIEDAANRALMSRTQFTKRFRETTGKSFLEYVTECRLEQAKVLLQDTDWTLALVGEFIGFRDTTRLHRLFDQYVGMSPAKYRQHCRIHPVTKSF